MERDTQFQIKLGKMINESVPIKSFDLRVKWDATNSVLTIEDMVNNTVTSGIVNEKRVGHVLKELLRFLYRNNFLIKEDK